MKSYLPYVVIGLNTGAVYALASLGLVLTYRTSGVFNFAHGAVGMFATYAFYSLRQHVPTAVAVLVAVLVVAPLLGFVVHVLFRRLAGAGAAAAIVASVGLLVGLQGLAVVIYGGQTRQVAAIFPTWSYRAFGVNVGIDQTLVVVISVAAALTLLAFFQLTPLGLRTRAVVDNRGLSGLVGTNAAAVTRTSWMLGAAFAGASGILFAPFVGLDSILLTLLVVAAFGAAAVGRLQSLPLTVLAAFGLGVAQSLATKITGEIGAKWLIGLSSSLPFLLLFFVLVLSRRGTLREAPTTRRAPKRGRTRAGRSQLPVRAMVITVVVAAALPPFVSASRVLTLTTAVAMALVFGSLRLLVGLSRLLSLGHAVFVVLGATTLAHLESAGVPYIPALILAGLIVMPLGAALAFPALRLSSLYLGLATFGFGILAESLLFPTGLVFGSDALASLRRPGFLAGDLAFYYFALAVVVIALVVVELVRATRLGRILTALSDSPTAVDSLGISPLASRVVTFAFSAFLAAIAGGLFGSLVQSLTPNSFTFFHSLLWVTVLVVAGSRTFSGTVLAAVLLVIVPSVATGLSEWQPVAFGMAAVFLAQADNGLVGLFSGWDFAGLLERDRYRLGSRRGQERLVRLDLGRTAAVGAER
jgi:branched-subunit amino acid ABC-type transport system permease component